MLKANAYRMKRFSLLAEAWFTGSLCPLPTDCILLMFIKKLLLMSGFRRSTGENGRLLKRRNVYLKMRTAFHIPMWFTAERESEGKSRVVIFYDSGGWQNI